MHMYHDNDRSTPTEEFLDAESVDFYSQLCRKLDYHDASVEDLATLVGRLEGVLVRLVAELSGPQQRISRWCSLAY